MSVNTFSFLLKSSVKIKSKGENFLSVYNDSKTGLVLRKVFTRKAAQNGLQQALQNRFESFFFPPLFWVIKAASCQLFYLIHSDVTVVHQGSSQKCRSWCLMDLLDVVHAVRQLSRYRMFLQLFPTDCGAIWEATHRQISSWSSNVKMEIYLLTYFLERVNWNVISMYRVVRDLWDLSGLPGATHSNLEEGLAKMAWDRSVSCAHKEMKVQSRCWWVILNFINLYFKKKVKLGGIFQIR